MIVSMQLLLNAWVSIIPAPIKHSKNHGSNLVGNFSVLFSAFISSTLHTVVLSHPKLYIGINFEVQFQKKKNNNKSLHLEGMHYRGNYTHLTLYDCSLS